MKIDIPHIAKLANLKLEEKEIPELEKQLSSILEYIEKLKELKTDNVSETSQVTGLENIEREDISAPSLEQKDALSGANKQHNGFFEVDGVLP